MKAVRSLQFILGGMSGFIPQNCKPFQVLNESEWFLQQKQTKTMNMFCRNLLGCSDRFQVQILFIWSRSCRVFTFTDKDVSCLCSDSTVAEGESLNWGVGGSDHSGQGERRPWSSPTEAPARRCRKRSNRRSRGGGPARTASPLRRSAVPAACASC